MEFQAVVLAAGSGSRMTSLTSSTPKALLPVANLPLIWYPLKLLDNAGVEEVIIIVQQPHKVIIQKTIQQLCDDNSLGKLQLDFVTIPANEDWGTANSLFHIRNKIKTDLLVLSCDLITDLPLHQLADIHRTQDATVTMLLAPLPEISETSAPGGKANKKIERDIIALDARSKRVLFLSPEADIEENISLKRSLFKRCPCLNVHTQLLDGHLYLMKRWLLDVLAQDKSISTVKGEMLPYLVRKQFSRQGPADCEKDMPNLDASVISIDTKQDIFSLCKEDELMKLALEMSSSSSHHSNTTRNTSTNKIRCYAFEHSGGFCIRANTLVTYCEANRQVPKHLSQISRDEELQLVHPTVAKQPKSTVGVECMVGEGTTIAEKVGIKRSVIGKHCSIGEKVRLTNTVIMDHVTIGEGSTLIGCIVCENAHIGEKSDLKDCVIGAAENLNPMSKFTNEILLRDKERMMEI